MRIVVTGASGQLGRYVIAALLKGPHTIDAWSGSHKGNVEGCPLTSVELTDRDALTHALDESDPDVIIHGAAVSSAAWARHDRGRAWAVNVVATEQLSRWAAQHGRRLIYTSTDLVFDGSGSWYREDDTPRPIIYYGQTKHEAEQFVLAVPRGLVARISLLYGRSRFGKEGYFDRTTAALAAGIPQAFFTDELRTPLHYAIAADILIRLAESETPGVIHVAGRERMSRHELMTRATVALGIDQKLVRPNLRADVPLDEPRPADVSLDSGKLRSLFPDLVSPSVEESLAVGG